MRKNIRNGTKNQMGIHTRKNMKQNNFDLRTFYLAAKGN